MIDYSIFTMCSKNYKDAYTFVIASWLRTSVKHIYVYTDDPTWKSKNERITIIHLFDEITNDWLVNTGRRVLTGKDIVKRAGEKIVFLDIDCYLIEDISHVFKKHTFDFAVTRLNSPRQAVSAGVFFFYNTKRNQKFFDEWHKEQIRNYKNRIGVVKYQGSYAQKAFSSIIRKYHKTKTHKIVDLDVEVYNRKAGKEKQNKGTIQALRKNTVKILHFYARTWRHNNMKKIIPYLNNNKVLNYFDLGTFNGVEVKLFVDMCKRLNITNYKIYCFEANKEMYDGLKKTFTDTRVVILNKAIADGNKVVNLYLDGKRGKGNSIFSTKSNVNENNFKEVDGILFSDWISKNVVNFKYSFNIVRFNIEGAEWFLMNDIVKQNIVKYINIFAGSHIGPDMPRVGELKDKVKDYEKLLKDNNIKIEIFNKEKLSVIESLIIKRK